jgi:hypothetical protein
MNKKEKSMDTYAKDMKTITKMLKMNVKIRIKNWMIIDVNYTS